MGYGPKLTAKQRAALLREIKNFDKKATLAQIEREAVGKKDVNAYEEWCDGNGGKEPVQANPDSLSDDCPQPWGKALERPSMIGLTPREKEALEYCDRTGMSREDAALEMGISVKTVKRLLEDGRRKLKGRI